MKCLKCNRDFPERLLRDLLTNKGQRGKVCPLCELKIVNKILGVPKNTPFEGTQAKKMYGEAVRHCQKQEKE